MSRRRLDLPDDLHSVVHPNRLLTKGFLLWASARPRALCHEEVRRLGSNRTLEAADEPNALPQTPADSWVVAMPLAEASEADAAVAWARGLNRVDRSRLAFFPLPGADASAVVDLCDDALGVDNHVVPIDADFPSFHRNFGRFLNLWTSLDVKAGRV